ncbi:MAG TPA: hypothetical protein VHF02_02360 [Luteimonas sp.]|nr:hypothetical protein [Luteimonas sp.]
MSSLTRTIALSLLTCALAACKPASTPATDTAATEPASSTDAPSTMAKVAASLNPLASPKDAIKASMEKFLAVRSYHATMEFEGGPGGAMGHHDIDFVAPDRYRMTMSMGTQVIIGDTMYMNIQGRTMKVPMPKGTLSQWRDPAKLAENEADMTVQAQGSDTVDGTRARKYLVHHSQPQPTDVTMWINDDNLPIRMQVDSVLQGKSVTSTIRYSRFDDPSITIDPPQ